MPIFRYSSPKQRVPADHPLRPSRDIVEQIRGALASPFDALYARTGQLSITQEKLLRALLLQLLHSLRTERQLMEQLDYNRLPGGMK